MKYFLTLMPVLFVSLFPVTSQAEAVPSQTLSRCQEGQGYNVQDCQTCEADWQSCTSGAFNRTIWGCRKDYPEASCPEGMPLMYCSDMSIGWLCSRFFNEPEVRRWRKLS